jgi:hypothetical protein
LIDLCLSPNLAVFELYHGWKKFTNEFPKLQDP